MQREPRRSCSASSRCATSSRRIRASSRSRRKRSPIPRSPGRRRPETAAQSGTPAQPGTAAQSGAAAGPMRRRMLVRPDRPKPARSHVPRVPPSSTVAAPPSSQALRRIDAAGWKPTSTLRADGEAGAKTDAAIADRMADDLLAIQAPADARAYAGVRPRARGARRGGRRAPHEGRRRREHPPPPRPPILSPPEAGSDDLRSPEIPAHGGRRIGAFGLRSAGARRPPALHALRRALEEIRCAHARRAPARAGTTGSRPSCRTGTTST